MNTWANRGVALRSLKNTISAGMDQADQYAP
jgi:hypothetical protein